MIAAAVSKEFGVLASDSAAYLPEKKQLSFETTKIVKVGKYVTAFMGSFFYFVTMDRKKFELPLDQLSFYLQDFLKSVKPKVEESLGSEINDDKENNSDLCLYVMGLHAKRPTLAQFNTANDFKPKYLWSDNGLKYSTILSSNETEQASFKDVTKYMENLSGEWAPTDCGMVGEVLARGIYKKDDLDSAKGLRKKTGGLIQAAAVKSDGLIYSLSIVEVIN